MRASPLHQIVEGDPQVAVQATEVGRGKGPGATDRRELRPPQHLVGDQVADPGDARLVEQPGLQRRGTAIEGPAKLGRRERQRIGPQSRLVGIEFDATEEPGVVDDQGPTVGEAHHASIPGPIVAGTGVDEPVDGAPTVHQQAPGHAEADAEPGRRPLALARRHRAGVEIQHEELPVPAGRDEAPTDHGALELPRAGSTSDEALVSDLDAGDGSAEGVERAAAVGLHLG